MQILDLHPNFQLPTRGSEHAAGYDIYMVEDGHVEHGKPVTVKLGFATAIPPGFYARLLPRSSAGCKHGLELNNTEGVIDADYRGEWLASLNIKAGFKPLHWKAGDRLLQFVLAPVCVVRPELEQVSTLSETQRGIGGLGSTGK